MISLSIADLKPALTGLAKVVSNKSSLPCLKCIRVDATPESVSLSGTGLDVYARVTLNGAKWDTFESFLLPLDRLQAVVKRFGPRTILNIEPDRVFCDLGTGRVSEAIESVAVEEFPDEPAFDAKPVAMPESVTIPNHKLLLWRGLADHPWALAGQKNKDHILVRVTAGDWTLTMKTIDGNYPNWQQVVPHVRDHKTVVTLPGEHEFTKLVTGLPGGDLADGPVDLVIAGNGVAIRDTSGQSTIALEGAKATGPAVTIRLNREYLVKAFAYGLTTIGLIDAISPLHFTCEGRQMVVMPLRVAEGIATPTAEPTPAPTEPQPASNNPAPCEPQTERKDTMPETIGHTNGATPHLNGAQRSTTPESPATEKPSIEAAIEKLDAFKVTFREALVGITELTALLRQAVREQKAGEKEVHQVRQTLRSLQSVRI